MAGMGPPPKDPRLRQRKNRTSTHALLPADGAQELLERKAPPLPRRACPCGGEKEECICSGSGVLPWHPMALDFWARVWRSPMSAEYVDADLPGLFVLADLTDRYWSGQTDLAAELRLQRQQYGLDALARRRLQWEVQKVEDGERKRRQPHPAKQGKAMDDPRRLLRAIK